MHNQRIRRLVVGLSLLTIGLNGCATRSGRSTSLRPAFGRLPIIQPGVPVQPHSSSQMQIQPGNQLQPTPVQPSGPTIQPGPSLPDASGRKSPYPESAFTRPQTPGGKQGGQLPSIVPRPEPGSPVAKSQTPASLSGQIEIIPGPAIRSHQPRLEILPPPSDLPSVGVEILPSPPSKRYEELPSPE